MNDRVISESPSTATASRVRRWSVIGVQVIAIGIAALAVFQFGGLWTLRGFAQAQPTPNPFTANSFRYAVAVLWPIPGAVLLFASASGFGGRRPWWWIPLAVSLVWFAAYVLVRPPQTYYYWLAPVQP